MWNLYSPALLYFHNYVIYSSAPKIEVACSQMYTPVYQTARRHFPESRDIHIHCTENLISPFLYLVLKLKGSLVNILKKN
jgi:hypothetical protein